MESNLHYFYIREYCGKGNGMNNVSLQDISFSYGNERVLKNVNLTIREGEFFTLLGPSGCGKTTILRILAGFLRPTDGTVRIGETDITDLPAEKRNMGIVFQNYALFPNLNVRDNVMYGLKVRKTPKAEAERICAFYMDLAGLSGYGERKVQELSGGQQQRVAIARALAIEPRMLLLDEPMSNLDAALRVKMREEIRAIQKKTGITTLFITHDQQEALSISDRIAVMRDGEVLQTGTPEEIYNHPNQAFVAGFVGASNEIGGRFVRPEHLRLTREPLSGGGEEREMDPLRNLPVEILKVRFGGMYYDCIVTDGTREYRVAEWNRGEAEKVWVPGERGYLSEAVYER